MNKIKRIPKKDMDDFVTIVANAYPGIKINTVEEKDKLKQRLLKNVTKDPTNSLFGLYKSGKLAGVMSLHDFTMTMLSTRVLTGGIGLVAVDLAHKKEKVCKELVEFFLGHYSKKGAPMTALYPFRPDFYRKMGFGYGAKINQYRIKPRDLPRGKSRSHICFLDKEDRKELVNCYNRFAEKTHGMMTKTAFELKGYERPVLRVVGYKSGRKVHGYVAFAFKPVREGNFILNDMVVHEFIYENSDVLSELLTFLHTQDDEINRIIINTHDEYLHYLPSDPRDDSADLFAPVYHETNLQGVGIMYRVIDTPGVFEALNGHNFGNQDCRLKIKLADSFLPKNQGSCIINFVKGRPHLRKSAAHDVEISLDIADFSSLIMGAVDFRSLHDYGLAEISDKRHLNTVNKIFLTDRKPKTTTQF